MEIKILYRASQNLIFEGDVLKDKLKTIVMQ